MLSQVPAFRSNLFYLNTTLCNVNYFNNFILKFFSEYLATEPGPAMAMGTLRVILGK